MKKNLNRRDDPSSCSYTIQDYGHDRTVHSLGRGGRKAMAHRRHLRWLAMLAALAAVAVLVILVLFLWPLLPFNQAATTAATTSRISSDPTSTQAGVITEATASAAGSSAALSPSPAATSAPAATISASERQSRLANAGTAVLALLNGKKGRFGVYYQNLQNGEKWTSNAELPFVAASSIKLGVNTYLYTKIASGEIKPDEILTYDSRAYPTGDYEAGTGTIQGKPNGTKLTVRETSGLSIRISDNCGTNMVIRRLGGIDAVNPFLSSISSVVDYRKSVAYLNYTGQSTSGKHRTCALDLGSHAVRLYELWQANQVVYQPLIDDLCHTEFDFGIQKGIPAGILVAHKIGTNGTYSAENDVGIVMAGEPYVLCVMTEMASAASAHQIQADISKIFYEYISGLSPR